MDAARLNEIVHGRRGITADTALRLSRYLGISAEFWLGLQADYDLRVARQLKLKEIEREVKPKSRAERFWWALPGPEMVLEVSLVGDERRFRVQARRVWEWRKAKAGK